MNQTFGATYAVSVADLHMLDTLPRETRELVHRYVFSVVEEAKSAAENSYEESLNELSARVAELEGLMETKLHSSDLLHSIAERVRGELRSSTQSDRGIGHRYNKIHIKMDDLITEMRAGDSFGIHTAAIAIAEHALYIALASE